MIIRNFVRNAYKLRYALKTAVVGVELGSSTFAAW